MIRVGVCFSKEFRKDINPVSHLGVKLPVYLRLLELCRKEGWEAYVLTRRTYKRDGIFKGGWVFRNSKLEAVADPVRIDLVYDRTGGVEFPPSEKEDVIFVNNREFKVLCNDKWKGYQEIGRFMPKTFWVGKRGDLKTILPKIRTDWVVLKPFNGLKGIGVYIGLKDKAQSFSFDRKYPKYIAQEFVDTSKGIEGLISGYHDLRVAIVNNTIVWCHIRTPQKGSFRANVAAGGTLKEISPDELPEKVKEIVGQVSAEFFRKYENPIYSLDFGIEKGRPYIFEMNDQIGFPTWGMKNREVFLRELVNNFKSKLK